MLAYAQLGGSHLGLGQVVGFPPQPSGGLSLQPGATTVVLTWGCCLHFPNPACLHVGRGGSPAPCSRNSKFSGRGMARGAPAPRWLPTGQGMDGLPAMAGGETSSSTLPQITITCHMRVSHNPIEIKAAENWSKQDTFLL